MAALAGLPRDLLTRVVVLASSVEDLCALICTARAFAGPPFPSLVEDALRERARRVGGTVNPPAGWRGSACAWLVFRERARRMALSKVVAASTCFSAFVDAMGALWTCGTDPQRCGLLGHGEGVWTLEQPARLQSLSSVRLASVAAGDGHSLAVTETGAVYSWGHGADGCLGLGDNSSRLTPAKIEALREVRVVAVAAGFGHSLALSDLGNVFSWGNGDSGRLGQGDMECRLTPTPIEALAVHVVAVAAGAAHNLALTVAGAAYSWGHGGNGRLGHGRIGKRLTPTRIEALAEPVVSVAAGEGNSFFVTEAGAVYSCGFAMYGEHGHGQEQQNVCKLARIQALAETRVVAVSAGGYHTLALTDAGTVFSWGNCISGCLGHGSDMGWPKQPGKNPLRPARIKALDGVRLTAVEAGNGGHSDATSFAVAANGMIFGWGSDESHALGFATQLTYIPPGATAQSGGTRVSLAPRELDALRCAAVED